MSRERQSPTDAAVHEALQHLRSGRPDKAIERLESALKEDPEHLRAREMLGVACGMAGDLDTGIAHLEAVAADGFDSARTRYNLGLLYEQRGQEAEATRQMEAVLRLDPDHAQAGAMLERLRGKPHPTDPAVPAQAPVHPGPAPETCGGRTDLATPRRKVLIGAVAGAAVGALIGLMRAEAMRGDTLTNALYYVPLLAFVAGSLGAVVVSVWIGFGRDALTRLGSPDRLDVPSAEAIRRRALVRAAVGGAIGWSVGWALSGNLLGAMLALSGGLVGCGLVLLEPTTADQRRGARRAGSASSLTVSATEVRWEGGPAVDAEAKVLSVTGGSGTAPNWKVLSCPWWLGAHRADDDLVLWVRNCGPYRGRVRLTSDAGDVEIAVSSQVTPDRAARWLGVLRGAIAGLILLALLVLTFLAQRPKFIDDLPAPALAVSVIGFAMWGALVGGERLFFRSALGWIAAIPVIAIALGVMFYPIAAAGPFVWGFVVGGVTVGLLAAGVFVALTGAGLGTAVVAAVAAGLGGVSIGEWGSLPVFWAVLLLSAPVGPLLSMTAMGAFLAPCREPRSVASMAGRHAEEVLPATRAALRRARTRLSGLLDI